MKDKNNIGGGNSEMQHLRKYYMGLGVAVSQSPVRPATFNARALLEITLHVRSPYSSCLRHCSWPQELSHLQYVKVMTYLLRVSNQHHGAESLWEAAVTYLGKCPTFMEFKSSISRL
jgi:hypothetical protein